MSATDSLSVDGIPVEIGRIDRELGRLWEESGDSKTRASLINFVVYTEDPESVPDNTRLIAEIAREHACRAILVLAQPGEQASGASAWIAAHCHLAGKGGGQICSEQITFHLRGEAAEALPNIVFSHLDSDLPLVVWWRADPPAEVDEKLWRWVDRVIFDSAVWKKPLQSFERFLNIAEMRGGGGNIAPKAALCDLNWARLLETRYAFASLFDYAPALSRLAEVDSVTARFGPGSRTAALLFLGWLASGLGWKVENMMGKDCFMGDSGGEIPISLEEVDGQPGVHCICLCAGDARFSLELDESGARFLLRMSGEGVPPMEQFVHAGNSGLADVLLDELGRGGSHPLFFRALDSIRPLL